MARKSKNQISIPKGQRIKNRFLQVETDYNILSQMTTQQKIEQAQALAKRANQRLKELEKHNLDNDTWAYGKAQKYLKQQDRTRFYGGKKYNSVHDLNRQLQELTYFINARSSTISGINAMNKQRYETFKKNHGNIDISHYKDFYDFLGSEQFKGLMKMLPSNEVMDDFAQALEQGTTLDEIEKQYAEYMNNDITFEKVQEKYNRAKWQLAQNGSGLLK